MSSEDNGKIIAPDPNNPFMVWPLKTLVEFRSDYLEPIISELYKAMETNKLEVIGYKLDKPLYENILRELKRKGWSDMTETFDDYLEQTVHPDNIQSFVDIMSFDGVKEYINDAEQWAKWEMEMYLGLADALDMWAPEVEELVEVYPEAWRVALKHSFELGIHDSS